MNNVLISFSLMGLLIFCGVLIGKFFDVKESYYIPFLAWGLALCIFNLLLDKRLENAYMINIK